MKPLHEWSLTDSGSVRNAWIIWAIFMVVICVIVAMEPSDRTVTPNYASAAMAWSERVSLYPKVDHIHGFLYLPQAAILYWPFVAMGFATGEVVYRVAIILFFAWSLYVFANAADRSRGESHFLLMSLLCLPLVAGNARNGQFNLPLTSCFMLATVSLMRERWTWATIWLVLGLALKPIAVVMLLLAGVVYWRTMWWRLLVGLLVLFGIPFLFAPSGYVIEQYQQCIGKMLTAGSTDDANWYDLRGFLMYGFDIDPSPRTMTLLRLFAAVGTLAIVWLARQRFDARTAAFMLYLFTASYLMLFSPRTEGLTYILVVPGLVLMLIWAWWVKRSIVLSLFMLATILGVNFSYNVLELFWAVQSLIRMVYEHEYVSGINWLRPGMLMLVVVYLVIQVLIRRNPTESTRICT